MLPGHAVPRTVLKLLGLAEELKQFIEENRERLKVKE